MRDPRFQTLRLNELGTLVIPPILCDQWRIAHASDPHGRNGSAPTSTKPMLVPVAAAVWARVSPEIDRRLQSTIEKPTFGLLATEWSSGDNLWLIATAGDPRATPTFLKQLMDDEFKGQNVKLRAAGANGKPQLCSLAEWNSRIH